MLSLQGWRPGSLFKQKKLHFSQKLNLNQISTRICLKFLVPAGSAISGSNKIGSASQFNVSGSETMVGTGIRGNISRGPTFGDFVTIRKEASMQGVTVARLQSTRAQTPLSPPFFKCNLLRESLSENCQNIPCGTLKSRGVLVGNLCISLVGILQLD